MHLEKILKKLQAQKYTLSAGVKIEKSYSGKPYCTICSKMALDSGISVYPRREICPVA
jgi:hypothetical protein